MVFEHESKQMEETLEKEEQNSANKQELRKRWVFKEAVWELIK